MHIMEGLQPHKPNYVGFSNGFAAALPTCVCTSDLNDLRLPGDGSTSLGNLLPGTSGVTTLSVSARADARTGILGVTGD